MQIETPPTEKRYDRPEGERRGLLIVHTGDGKGKSTAAFGLALRAFGRQHVHGKRVAIFQFMKVPSARFGEHRAFEQLGLPIEGLGDGFSWKSQDLEHSAQLARDGWQKARSGILGGEHFLVVLDEITYPLIYGWLPLGDVLQTLRERPKDGDDAGQARLQGRRAGAARHRGLSLAKNTTNSAAHARRMPSVVVAVTPVPELFMAKPPLRPVRGGAVPACPPCPPAAAAARRR